MPEHGAVPAQSSRAAGVGLPVTSGAEVSPQQEDVDQATVSVSRWQRNVERGEPRLCVSVCARVCVLYDLCGGGGDLQLELGR